MTSEGTSDATWKALSTLEWKKKQKKPVAAGTGVGAILGEAADVVAGKWASSGPGGPGGSSAYLNRLSEIQIQDEAYIHQQLVKPDEVKPKRPPHRLLLAKGSRSGRGLKISLSRKVRFNEADGSPTNKSAAGAGALKATAAGFGPAAAASRPVGAASAGPPAVSAARTSSGGVSIDSEPVPVKAVRRVAVGFAEQQVDGGTSSSTSSLQVTGQQSGACTPGVANSTGVSAAAVTCSSSNECSTVPSAVGATQNNNHRVKQPAQDKPSCSYPQPQQKQPASQHAGSSSTSASSSASPDMLHWPPPAAAAAATAAGQHSGGGRSGSRSQAVPSTADNALMDRFLPQQQPFTAGSFPSPITPAGGDQHDARMHDGSLDRSNMQPAAGRQQQDAGAAAAAGPYSGRRTTDLVDKQLQRLRDSTTPASSSGGSSSGGCNSSGNTITAVGTNSNSSAQPAVVPGASRPFDDFTASMGYRPIAIPQELFDRWSNMGGGSQGAKQPTSATPPQPTTSGAPLPLAAAAKAGAGGSGPGAVGGSACLSGSGPSAPSLPTGGSSSSSKLLGGHRTRSTSSLDLTSGPRQVRSASPSSVSSRPDSGNEQHAGAASRPAAGAPNLSSTGPGRPAPAAANSSSVNAGVGGTGGVGWQRDSSTVGSHTAGRRASPSPPPAARRLSASNVLEGRAAADPTGVLHNTPHRQRTAEASTLSSIAAAIKLPSSSPPPASKSVVRTTAAGRVQPPHTSMPGLMLAGPLPASGRASHGAHEGPASPRGHHSSSSGSSHGGNAGSSSSSSHHGIEGGSSGGGSSSWDTQTGRQSPLRPASHAAGAASIAAAASASGSLQLGSKRVSSRAVQDESGAASTSSTGSVAGLGAGQQQQQRVGSSLRQQQHWQDQQQQHLQQQQQQQSRPRAARGVAAVHSSSGGAGGSRMHLPSIGSKAVSQHQQHLSGS